MKKLLVFIAFLLTLLVGGVYYLFKPKSLGITYEMADHASAVAKIGTSLEELPEGAAKGKTLVLTGSHKVETSFSSRELTAMASLRREQYAPFPFRSVQIRVNEDGSVEGSGTINYQDAFNYLVALGVPPESISEGAKELKIPNANIPVYLKVAGNITNNKSNIDVLSAKAVGVSLPSDLIEEYTPYLNAFIEAVIADRKPSYDIEKLEVVGGSVYFKGTSPDKEQAVRAGN